MRAPPRDSAVERDERRVAIFLHAHLPDCRRPEQRHSLEETWFFEAMIGTYLPLLGMLERLEADQVRAALTISLSPPLLLMLRDEPLLDRFRQHLEGMEALALLDATGGAVELRTAAKFHASVFRHAREDLDRRRAQARGVLSDFKRLAKAGRIELATTAASHAYLPACQTAPETVVAQIAIALDVFRDAFCAVPHFFWLPECGWFPGLDAELARHGITSFAVEEHAICQAVPGGAAIETAVTCPSGVRALGRHGALSRLVWSSISGYPGHGDYREFHRDQARERPEDRHGSADDAEFPTHPAGLKYWRVTARDAMKEPYDPVRANERARLHAREFVSAIRREARPGICFLPFDAELFGHWWFEGPQWLEEVLRGIERQDGCQSSTTTDALAAYEGGVRGTPAVSSWGPRGTNAFWVSHDTAWIYPQLAGLHSRLSEIVRESETVSVTSEGMHARALQRAAQLLLLAQASDWPFMISTGLLADLARERLDHLIGSAHRLLDGLETGAIDETLLTELEKSDPAYGTIDLRHFTKKDGENLVVDGELEKSKGESSQRTAGKCC